MLCFYLIKKKGCLEYRSAWYFLKKDGNQGGRLSTKF